MGVTRGINQLLCVLITCLIQLHSQEEPAVMCAYDLPNAIADLSDF